MEGQQVELVFTTNVGTALEPCTINQQLGRLLRESGLPHIRLHDCRHTAATLLLAQDVPVNVVSQILGHANPTSTLNVYAKVLKTQQEDAAQKMEDLFFGASGLR